LVRSISDSYSTALAGSTMAVVELFSLSSAGMSTFLYTDAGQTISFAGLTYDPYPIKRGKISFSTDLKTDETTISMAKNWGTDMAIRKDILAGATVQIHRVNTDYTNLDYVLLFDGEVSDTTTDESVIKIRCTTLDFLNTELPLREIQVACNWQLYGPHCGITLSNYLVTTADGLDTTTPEEIAASEVGFAAGITFSDQYFRGGYVVGLSTDNMNLTRHITSHVGNTISVLPPFPFDFELTDNIQFAPGCDHNILDCENKFNNLTNYGGFPWIPNQDNVL